MSRRHALPIFLLYFLTSSAFLSFFGYLFFEREVAHLIFRTGFEMREIRRDIFMKFIENGELVANDFKDFNATVFDLKNKKFIKNDFNVSKPLPPNFFDGKNVIVEFRINSKRHHGNEYKALVKSPDLREKISDIKFKIFLACTAIWLGILLIAYFLIKLSLRPLYEKIEFLDGFLRDTTHEINTPLSVILMSAELFKNDPPKYLANIKTAANTLSNLYEDLVALKLNKKENEHLEEILLDEMLDERIEYFSTTLSQKDITLNTDIDEVLLVSSKFKLRKIIDNLLSNAVKYCNEKGEISITLNKNFLSIKNTGSGIAKENLPHIFELYKRFDERNGGFGVGLSIVKGFCDELGFSIKATSDKNTTEFVLYFSKNK